MSDSKAKNQSSLVNSVIDLNSYYTELVRLGAKIDSMDIKTDSDFDLLQRLVNQFAECGAGLSQEVLTLSKNLNEMREQAEAVTKLVETKAEVLHARRSDAQKRMDEFRALSEKVRELTVSLNDLKPGSDIVSEEERTQISKRLVDFEVKLHPLIAEALHLKKVAQESKMKVLEQSADSLGQSLTSISQKLNLFQREGHFTH